MKAIVDANSFWLHNADTYLDTDTVVATLPPAGLVKPKWDGAAWIEGASAQELTDDLAEYKSVYIAKVDVEAEAKFNELEGTENPYIVRAHTLKLFEALERYNSDHAASEKPANSRADVAGQPVLTKEAAKKGVTITSLAEAIRNRNAAVWQRVADIEEIRPYYKSQINAAANRAAVDTEYAAWTAALALIT